MSLTSSPLRRLALIAGGALLVAGGAGAAYATSLSSGPAETGYATVVDGETSPGQVTTDRDCPERSGGSGSPGGAEGSAGPESQAPSSPTEPSTPSDGDL